MAAAPPSGRDADRGQAYRETDMRYRHTMIRIRSIEDSLDFFCNKLGLVETRRVERPEHKYTLIFLAAPQDVERAKTDRTCELELTYNYDPEAYGSGRNFGHLAYEVDNIYEVCQRLKDKGVTINRPPRDGGMAFVRSPDLISIELLQKGERLPAQEPWKSMPNVGEW
jgi:lactoylglutathione lyase